MKKKVTRFSLLLGLVFSLFNTQAYAEPPHRPYVDVLATTTMGTPWRAEIYSDLSPSHLGVGIVNICFDQTNLMGTNAAGSWVSMPTAASPVIWHGRWRQEGDQVAMIGESSYQQTAFPPLHVASRWEVTASWTGMGHWEQWIMGSLLSLAWPPAIPSLTGLIAGNVSFTKLPMTATGCPVPAFVP